MHLGWSKEVHSIVLHNFELTDQKVKNFFDYAKDVANQFNLSLNRMSISSHNSKLNSSQVITFKGGVKKLEKHGFDEISYLSFITNPPKEYMIGMYDAYYIFKLKICNINLSLVEQLNNQNLVQFTVDKNYCTDFNLLKNIIYHLQKITKAQYGYYFFSPLKKNPPPDFYTYANCNNDPDKYYDTKNRKWYDVIDYKNTYQDNQIRDIYPLNFLTEPHLDYQVNNSQTLRQFIESNSAHGKLEQLSEGFYCWEVAEDNCRLVRNKLGPSGIIVSYPANRLESHGFGMADAAWHKIIDPLTGGRRY